MPNVKAFLALILVSVSLSFVVSMNVSINCETQNFTKCYDPVQKYKKNQEFVPLLRMRLSANVNESLLADICRFGKTTLGCTKESMECRGSTRFFPDIHDLYAGWMELLTACDLPDSYSNLQTILRCQDVLEQIASPAIACGRSAFKEIGQTSFFENSTDVWAAWRSGSRMKQYCCAWKAYGECYRAEVADKCGVQAQDLNERVNNAIMEAFRCNGPRGDNCPPPLPLTPEDSNATSLDYYIPRLLSNTLLRSSVPIGGNFSVNSTLALKSSVAKSVLSEWCLFGLIVIVVRSHFLRD
ncbi:uncharacterized protein LOC129596675 [Paramacrobiotus metropolitanus]|uniref:uncharacterized protein LOC129596675 n=1 Tax=Paramacrobiotus metropolitanus TaxID=2943436 RepID=UPI0024463104|nr:uncharacterized protein LOC129596675 [Paramacrobiotus metropolitanus]